MVRISYRWLQDFIELPESPEEVRELLTFLGFEVEELIHVPGVPEGVYAGYVVALNPHPNADKLRLATIALDGETKTVVCGAPNIEVGQWVPLALVGTKLGDLTLTPKSIRGIASEGMVCSERELGRSEDHSGIWVLGYGDDDEWNAGEPLHKRITGDAVFGIEVTLNRADCLSHLGIARELAAKLNRKLTLPPALFDEIDLPASHEVSVVLDEPVDCLRYRGRVLRNVDARRTSPFWVRERLKRMNTRAINAVVDATNYVMFETGHPLHAFDRAFLHGREIGARAAIAGEKFVTLDDIEHTLETGDVLIRDTDHAVALGGIMGGKNSEIRETTTDVLLEAAYFEPVRIRRTAKRLGIFTESSKRFERGADPEGVAYAMDRCTSMIHTLAGGEVYHGVVEAYTRKVERPQVSLRTKRLHAILGYNAIQTDQIEDYLNRLGLSTVSKSADAVTIQVPSWRHDISREIDLVEEVGRLHGYDLIPAKLNANVPLKFDELPGWSARKRWAGKLRALGISEAVSNSMGDPDDLAALELLEGAVKIANPIAPELSVLRPNLLISLVKAAAHNLRHGRKRIALFEIGRVFGKGWITTESIERWHLGIVLAGLESPIWWRESKPRLFDASDVMGILSQIQEQILPGLHWEAQDSLYLLEEAFTLSVAGKPVGFAGKLPGAVRKETLRPALQSAAKRFDLNEPLWVIEINAEPIPLTADLVTYRSFPRVPAVERDLSFTVPTELTAGTLLDAITKAVEKEAFAVHVELFDRHHEKNAPTLSLGIRLRMQADRTLTEQEITATMQHALKACEAIENVKLRGA